MKSISQRFDASQENPEICHDFDRVTSQSGGGLPAPSAAQPHYSGCPAPLDLINEHLTEWGQIPAIPIDGHPGWFEKIGGSIQLKPQHFVVKIQRFKAGGFEATVVPVDFRELDAAAARRFQEAIEAQAYGPKKREKPEEMDENAKISSINRSKRAVRHRIKSMGCDRLLTLTRREVEEFGYWTVEEWAAGWDRFIRACKRLDSAFEYVAVLERHKKGNFHLHAASRGRLNIKVIRGIWWACCGGRGSGNIDIQYRKNMTDHARRSGIAKYVSKYITKQADMVEFNKKRYWSSRHKLPDVERYVLDSDHTIEALIELAEMIGLDYIGILQTAFRFKDDKGAWFSYDDHMLNKRQKYV